jgi:hypothetical protein
MCAGQGRDVIPVLGDHPRGREVDALLVELDSENVAFARRTAADAGLANVTVVESDAAVSDVYQSYAPADVLLACGIFGNISDVDLESTVRHLSMLCADHAAVIWTRHRKQPEVINRIQQWFEESGFRNLSFDALDNDRKMGVGVAELVGPPQAFHPGHRFFTFVR